MSNFRKILQKLKQLLYRKTTGAIVAAIISAIYIARNLNKQSPIIKLSYFLGALSQDIITEVVVNGTTVFFKSIGSEVWYQTNSALLTKDRLFKLLSKKPNVVFSSVDVDDGTKQNYVNIAVLAATAFFGYKAYNMITGQDQGTANLKKVYTSDTRFTDIHGLDDAKKELQEIINFLRDPQRYKAVGARLRRGVLLYGPSGTGKTLLARAIAGEANCSFLSCAASEFIELYVGVGPKRVRELFARARSLAPCIIFIDEIDGIGTKRQSQFSNMEAGGGDNEKTSTLNQLLTEMDGFRENHDIVIIAATNRPTLLDEALIRSGRFDTKIKIGLPDLQDRVGIMKIHLRNKKQSITDIMLGKIAEGTNGFSGADMENIINECAYVCVQNNRNVIEDSDLQEAFDKITTQRKLM